MKIDSKYLIDTVALSKIDSTITRSSFFEKFCRIPEEILYEFDGNYDEASLMIKYDVDVRILENVKKILANCELIGSILDLYSNKGNGDILILASALKENEQSKSQLFGTEWIIVTDDLPLTKIANTYGVKAISTENFILISRAYKSPSSR